MHSRLIEPKRRHRRHLPATVPAEPQSYVKPQWEQIELPATPLASRLWRWFFNTDYSDADSRGARITRFLRLWLLCILLSGLLCFCYVCARNWNVFSGD
jgi:hypothetical protein